MDTVGGPKEHTFTQAYHMAQVTSWLDRGGDINVTSFSKQGCTLLMMACVQNDHVSQSDRSACRTITLARVNVIVLRVERSLSEK